MVIRFREDKGSRRLKGAAPWGMGGVVSLEETCMRLIQGSRVTNSCWLGKQYLHSVPNT